MRSLLSRLILFAMLATAAAVPGAAGGCSGGADDAADDDDDDDDDSAPVESRCNDGRDDDGDGDTDCADADCASSVTCLEIDCDNGADDDGDQYVDCDDSDCDGLGSCEVGNEHTCDDGLDNDDDATTDCRDADCDGLAGCEHGSESTCDDGLDNDDDSLADCADADCAAVPACAGESACGDDADNDGDGAADCADDDCVADPLCLPESACGDAVDNDGDGAADCADDDCTGLAGCEPDEATCGDGLDNDGDGDADCADDGCALACATTCPAGNQPLVYVYAGGGAVAVPSPGQAQVSIESFNTGTITSLRVAVDIAHGRTSDLSLYLLAPDNTTVILANHAGSGANFTDTVFANDATAVLAGASNPFTGSFQPTASLAPLLDRAPFGPWRLSVYDNVASINGSITDFAMVFCVCSGPECEQSAAVCTDGIDNDDDTLADCDDPSCDAYPGCLPEADCADVLDGDFDGDADCADADCDGRDGCEHSVELTCGDFFDNDADDVADCLDDDCDAAPACVPELDCGDGVDNDGDGATDCFDPGCLGVLPCQIGNETLCNDGVDNDADGATDCAEASCAVACAIACPAGSTAIDLTGGNLPLTIADNTTVTSPVTFGGAGVVSKLAVETDITHTYDGDLVLSLVAPTNTTVTLANRLGGSGENFVDTVFVDGAPTAITAGVAPFTGFFAPEQALAGLAGIPAAGTWSLRVADQAGSDTGSLTGFVLHLCVCSGADCEQNATACTDGVDNDGDVLADCDDPSCDAYPGCLPEAACADALDDDFDGEIDCADADCDGIDGCEVGVELTCGDFFDNDADALPDCLDDDCDLAQACVPESDCGDGIDNDADGAGDCFDSGCLGVLPCQVDEETRCNDGVDNDADGLIDCAETSCALACALACPVGTTAIEIFGANLPLAITDNTTINSPASFVGAGTVSKVAVEVDLTHTYDGDLVLSLIAPSAAAFTLSNRRGSGGDNFVNTVFVDGAPTAITAGAPPFTGFFTPEQPLAPLTGTAAAGTWTLRVADQAGGDIGSLTGVTVLLCIASL